MQLSAPAPRLHLHSRTMKFFGYRRTDGLWDVEGEVMDTKEHDWTNPENRVNPARTPIHHMLARITFDDVYVIHAIEVAMPDTPYPECQDTRPAVQSLVGAKLSAGWRKTIETQLGGVAGCTHVRELLASMATTAYQTVAGEWRRTRTGVGPPSGIPGHYGTCMSYRIDGPVVVRLERLRQG